MKKFLNFPTRGILQRVVSNPTFSQILIVMCIYFGLDGGVSLYALDTWEAKVVGEQTLQGRSVLRYEHEALKAWGYPGGERKYFSVILPEQPEKKAPLVVYLHSAGGQKEVQVPLAVAFAVEGGTDFYGLALNCGETEWWWGYHMIHDRIGEFASKLTPTEQRVMATVEWVVQKYDIDRNRIYLTGHSMGGTGSLGIGLCHGDVFASIQVGVPAGAAHVLQRMHFPEIPEDLACATLTPEEKLEYLRRVSAVGLPDPPPVFNFSSHTDYYAKGQELLLRYVQQGKLFMVFNWGPYGHAVPDGTNTNPAAFEFPWMTIRKDEAYPAFTHASTDNHYPGLQGKGPDQEGQMNAFFRWKTVSDTPDELILELWLVRADELKQTTAIPAESIVDITPRRLQKFEIKDGKSYPWQLEREGKVIQSGTVQPDSVGLLTIPQVKVAGEPARLRIRG